MDNLNNRKICFNTKCPGANSGVWKLGWRLQSGLFADLCDICGMVFEQSRFCEAFHADDAGWRTCNTCNKRIHCGCIASASLFVHLDQGGVECIECSKRQPSAKTMELSSESTSLTRLKHSESSEEEQIDKKPRLMDSLANFDTLDPINLRQSQDMQTSEDMYKAEVKHHFVPPQYQVLDKEVHLPDGNSVIPLFEKMLTASDAGRIGRLVLPKACAEAFFPPISVPEGIPIKMYDMTGQEWQFQFRFWPNNSSRMYVLEGITPCVKSMQLQAGDVVTFSRIEPGGKMVMGYRRSSPTSKSKSSKSGATVSKNSRDYSVTNEYSVSRTTWEEAQDLLTPPPGVTPSIMTIDGHRFEEYEEPPILSPNKKLQHASSVSYASSLA